MKKYKIIKKPLFLHVGIVELTEKQIKNRQKSLLFLKKSGQCEVVREVCFKVGEVIGIDHQTAKSLLKMNKIELDIKAI